MNVLDEMLRIVDHRRSIAGKECAVCIRKFDRSHLAYLNNLRWLRWEADANNEVWHLAVGAGIAICGAYLPTDSGGA